MPTPGGALIPATYGPSFVVQVRFDGHGDLAFRARERPSRSGWSEVEQPGPDMVFHGP